MAEMHSYASDLRSMTQALATLSLSLTDIGEAPQML